MTTDDTADTARRLVVCPDCGQRSIRGAAEACAVCGAAAERGQAAAPLPPLGVAVAGVERLPVSRRCSWVFVLGLTALLAGWAAPYAAPAVALACLVVAATLGHRPVPVLDRRLRRVGVTLALVLLAVNGFGVVAAIVAERG